MSHDGILGLLGLVLVAIVTFAVLGSVKQVQEHPRSAYSQWLTGEGGR